MNDLMTDIEFWVNAGVGLSPVFARAKKLIEEQAAEIERLEGAIDRHRREFSGDTAKQANQKLYAALLKRIPIMDDLAAWLCEYAKRESIIPDHARLKEAARRFAVQAAEIERLRSRGWLGEKLRWHGQTLFLGPFEMGRAHDDLDGAWIAWVADGKGEVASFPAGCEAAARAAVEKAVIEALGQTATCKEGLQVQGAAPARTCETCAHEEMMSHHCPCSSCGGRWRKSHWTPKTTASEEGAP